MVENKKRELEKEVVFVKKAEDWCAFEDMDNKEVLVEWKEVQSIADWSECIVERKFVMSSSKEEGNVVERDSLEGAEC
jgi:sporulation protein YlmC with PRC-barrel domain